MPDNLRVVPWEQFNTYNREIMEKVESLDTTNANENDVLTYTGSTIAWQPSQGGFPDLYDANEGDVLVVADSSSTRFVKWETPEKLPSTDNASDGDVLTYNGEDIYWQSTVEIPSLEYSAEAGDVLTVESSGEHGEILLAEWKPPKKELPSTGNAHSGDVLTYNGDDINWATPQSGGDVTEQLTAIDGYSKGGSVLVTSGTGSGVEWVSKENFGMPSTVEAHSGDVLTYNGNGTEWRATPEELPSTDNANSGDILTVNGTGYAEWAKLQPWLFSTHGAISGDVLTVSGTGRAEWAAPQSSELPKAETYDFNKVLTVSTDGTGQVELIWAEPQSNSESELPSTRNVLDGDVLTYKEENLIWASPFPSIGNASEGDVLTVIDSGCGLVPTWATPQSNGGDISEQLASIGDNAPEQGYVLTAGSDNFYWSNSALPDPGAANDWDILTSYSGQGEWTAPLDLLTGTMPQDGQAYVLIGSATGGVEWITVKTLKSVLDNIPEEIVM